MAANEVAIHVTAKDGTGPAFASAKKGAEGLGASFTKVGQLATGFLAANLVAGGAQQLSNFFGDSISAASNLQQAVGGVQSVFKDNAATILNWGKNNAANFGLSQRAFNEMAGPLGAMLKNTGMDMSQVSTKTIDLTKRAADMAATFGGDATEALTAISAALRGETDPIERYGVSMSAAKVEAHALAMTGKTVASSLTDQEKAAARLELLFLQTADAEGQAAREADSHAGASARATAKMEDMQAQIGTKLLPLTVKLTEVKLAMIDVIVTKVIPALEALYARHWPALSKAINDVVKVVQDNWPLISEVFNVGFEHYKGVVNSVIILLDGLVQNIINYVQLIGAVFRGDWARVWQEMKEIAGVWVDTAVAYVENAFSSSALYNIGHRAGSALVRGIKDSAGDFLNLLTPTGALGAAGDALGIPDGYNPFRAAGGPVNRGSPYIVGERGPELFVPGQSGSIVPNHAMQGGGGGVTINVTNNIAGSIRSDRDLTQIIRDSIQSGGFHGLIPSA